MEVLSKLKTMVSPDEFIEIQCLEKQYQKYFYVFITELSEARHDLVLAVLKQVEYEYLTGTCDDALTSIVKLYSDRTNCDYDTCLIKVKEVLAKEEDCV